MKYYRRHLPHYQQTNAAIFITFRLSNSLPIETVESLRSEYELVRKSPQASKGMKNLALKRYFQKFDQFLDDQQCGHLFLSNIQVAAMLKEALHYRDGRDYDLLAYCIMPNHVHLVIRLINENATLQSVLQSLKTNTALRANKILNRNGSFWQHESYDHIVRNQDEFERIIRYVINNPVKSGLVSSPEEWMWSYYRKDGYMYK